VVRGTCLQAFVNDIEKEFASLLDLYLWMATKSVHETWRRLAPCTEKYETLRHFRERLLRLRRAKLALMNSESILELTGRSRWTASSASYSPRLGSRTMTERWESRGSARAWSPFPPPWMSMPEVLFEVATSPNDMDIIKSYWENAVLKVLREGLAGLAHRLVVGLRSAFLPRVV